MVLCGSVQDGDHPSRLDAHSSFLQNLLRNSLRNGESHLSPTSEQAPHSVSPLPDHEDITIHKDRSPNVDLRSLVADFGTKEFNKFFRGQATLLLQDLHAQFTDAFEPQTVVWISREVETNLGDRF